MICIFSGTRGWVIKGSNDGSDLSRAATDQWTFLVNGSFPEPVGISRCGMPLVEIPVGDQNYRYVLFQQGYSRWGFAAALNYFGVEQK